MEQTTLWDEKTTEIANPASLSELLKEFPLNENIQESVIKCYNHIKWHKRIMCAVSGGYDSDIMLDLVLRCGGKGKADFYWYDTGLEYDATKAHIAYLEQQYGVTIQPVRPKKHIPNCVREYGVPFWSKYASDMIARLQRHSFQWEYGSFEDLWAKYQHCKSALRWWCNDWGESSRFSIDYTPGLKEFLHNYPPPMKISAMCCEKAKKEPAHDLENSGYDLVVTGIRRAEGGKRSTTHKSCYDENWSEADNYRPLFWWTDQDKELYRKHFRIIRSDCYEVWGMSRTGCAGCPFGKKFEEELETVQLFEPRRYRAMLAVFGQSYDYTREFLKFRSKMKTTVKRDPSEIRMPGV